MSFKSSIQSTITEINNIENKTWSYDKSCYDKIPTKYVLSLLRRCSAHLSQLSLMQMHGLYTGQNEVNKNFLSNARLRLKEVLRKRENINGTNKRIKHR